MIRANMLYKKGMTFDEFKHTNKFDEVVMYSWDYKWTYDRRYTY